MKLPRRTFLHLAAGAAALPALSRIAAAQPYPARPVRIMVGAAAGGGADIISRLIGQQLAAQLGQQFIIENRPGAGTNIATEAVVRAAPDGYTLLMVTASNAINASLYDTLNFNFILDLAPVAGITRVPNVMEVNLSIPVRTVPEFIAYAKANRGRVSYASGGNGTTQHVSGELFKMMTGIDMQHIPYRGAGPALTDLLGGQVQLMFDTMTASIEHIKAGRLRALAVTTATRSEALPDLPAVAEFLRGYESTALYGIAVPRSTPAAIIDKLNREINAAVADPKISARLVGLGGSVQPGSPADFGKLIADETEKWTKVMKFSGAKPD